MSSSILARITERRQNFAAEKFTDLEVPTWGGKYPRAWIRVEPIPLRTISRFKDRAAKATGQALAPAVVSGNLSLVAAAAVKIVIGEGDEQAVFDLDSPDLLEALGIPDASGKAQVIQALVGTDITEADGYILALGEAVARHSGHQAEIAEDELAGE